VQGPGTTRGRCLLLAGLLPLLGLTAATSACAGKPGGQQDAGQETPTAKTSGARSSAGQLRLTTVANFDRPVEVKSAPGYPRLMFVVEQEGVVRVMRRGRKLPSPFLDISRIVQSGGEQGLLSIGFPPDYRRSGLFYVYYTDSTGDINVDEFRRSTPLVARPGSRRRVITIPHRSNSNHNGGQIQFLGRLMYFGTGDGGGAGDPDGNAQSLDSLLGKLIRIDPRRNGPRSYSVPAGNPFLGRPGRDEIYSYGLRNPFRWSFDLSGSQPRIALSDVGESGFEEINYLNTTAARGANFGWNRLEGFSEFNPPAPEGTLQPSTVLPHSEGYCSVIGGVVVGDPSVPSLRGRYLFTDFCRGEIRSLRPGVGRITSTRDTGLRAPLVSSFARGAGGSVYLSSLTGPVYRLRQQ
jgi:glucose/arabinose dehydrogenase